MKSLRTAIAIAAIAGTASLGGCITADELAQTTAQIQAQVQADTNLVCGFIPTAATIAALIPGTGSVVPEAASIATAICNAIAQAPPVQVQNAKLRSARLRADGNRTAVNVATVILPGGGKVPIAGQFTR